MTAAGQVFQVGVLTMATWTIELLLERGVFYAVGSILAQIVQGVCLSNTAHAYLSPNPEGQPGARTSPLPSVHMRLWMRQSVLPVSLCSQCSLWDARSVDSDRLDHSPHPLHLHSKGSFKPCFRQAPSFSTSSGAHVGQSFGCVAFSSWLSAHTMLRQAPSCSASSGAHVS